MSGKPCYLTAQVKRDLKPKIVFIAGPRQVGKTTIARSLPGAKTGYLCHLIKWVHFQQDTEGTDLELRYFRDKDGREVDFIVVDRNVPVLIVECKWADAEIDRSLKYFKSKFPRAEAWQLSAIGRKDYVSEEGIRVAPALALLNDWVWKIAR